MLVFPHHTDPIALAQPSLVGDAWATAVAPRLPATLAAQARTLKAFQRVRGLATPHDLLRGVLAYVVGPLSPRRLGAWAVLVGVAASAEAAWRQRLRTSHLWLLWLLSALVSTAAPAAPRGVRPAGRVLLVDASCLGQPGGTGDDWRLPLADDCTAGRLGQVQVTDRCGGEHLGRYHWQPGEVMVGDRGEGARRASARRRHPAYPPGHVPPGNGGGPAVRGPTLAPAPGRGTAGVAWLVPLGGPAVCRAARRRHAAAAGAAKPRRQGARSRRQHARWRAGSW